MLWIPRSMRDDRGWMSTSMSPTDTLMIIQSDKIKQEEGVVLCKGSSSLLRWETRDLAREAVCEIPTIGRSGD